VRLDLVDTAERRKAPADRLRKVQLGARLLGAERDLQDLAQLGFHRPAVPGGAHAQRLSQFGINIADGQRCHFSFYFRTSSLYAMQASTAS
jgi:hypothetical protein